jgi:hypothetical protein
MRRLLATIAAGSVLWAAMLGNAASLAPTRTSLAAGSSSVTACDRDGVDAGLLLSWRDHAAVERVRIGGIDDRCIGLSLRLVVMLPAGPVELGPVRIAPSAQDDNMALLQVPVDIRAIDVGRIHIAIS